MSRGSPLLILLAFVALIAGCATPRHETIQRLEAPADAEGQACVGRCDLELTACRERCRAAWQACAEQVEPRVDERFSRALQAYSEDLRRYRRELDWYEWDMWFGWNHGPGGFWASSWPYHAPWPRARFWIEPPGEPPTRESVRAGLLKESCQDDCGCQPRHEACFLACGGRVLRETRCVADCP